MAYILFLFGLSLLLGLVQLHVRAKHAHTQNLLVAHLTREQVSLVVSDVVLVGV